ncbi:uncharacterized protein MCYG_06204 [Microsporum canis CBS 113480]|uniref:Uncharacterized protein n=1 Tax=Arthroderma otae (strain ATCC MYA-4605 / CBS 113480) TaxID=554155 RepID=C5FU01_ARTOC|nr:uncharacterized protein MCYG_06204 [Microsporum canis CBS 113480]EEQ33385.1 predicted protein [Microsporum canis CBS 113480]
MSIPWISEEHLSTKSRESQDLLLSIYTRACSKMDYLNANRDPDIIIRRSKSLVITTKHLVRPSLDGKDVTLMKPQFDGIRLSAPRGHTIAMSYDNAPGPALLDKQHLRGLFPAANLSAVLENRPAQGVRWSYGVHVLQAPFIR